MFEDIPLDTRQRTLQSKTLRMRSLDSKLTVQLICLIAALPRVNLYIIVQ